MTGRIVNILEERGFFFVRGEDGVEYFAHKTALKLARWDDVQYDDQVTFEPSVDQSKGPRASWVTIDRLSL